MELLELWKISSSRKVITALCTHNTFSIVLVIFSFLYTNWASQLVFDITIFSSMTNCFHSSELLGVEKVKKLCQSQSDLKFLKNYQIWYFLQNHLIIDLTGKNTLLKWFKKIPVGIGILSNGTHSVKIK